VKVMRIWFINRGVKLLGIWLIMAVPAFGFIGGQVGGAAYLKLGMDSRGIALGRAYTAYASGASAIYWNPAGLLVPEIYGKRFDVLVMNQLNSQWDESYFTSAFAWRRKRFALGLGYMSFKVDDIPEYDNSMNYLGDFNNVEWTGLLGMAFDFPGLFSVGVTAFYLTHEYRFIQNADSTGFPINGFGINLGLRFNPFVQYDRLKVGVLLSDQKAIQGQDTTSLLLNVGFKWDVWRTSAPFLGSVVLLTDFEQERDFPVKLKFGTEIQLVNLGTSEFFIRGGIDDVILEMREVVDDLDVSRSQIIRLNKKYTVGFGVHQRLFSNKTSLIIDYAWVKETFRTLHFITIKIVI